LKTGLVSPQFHVKYDDSFETLRNNVIAKSMWQSLAGFETIKRHPDTIRQTRNNIPAIANSESGVARNNNPEGDPEPQHVRDQTNDEAYDFQQQEIDIEEGDNSSVDNQVNIVAEEINQPAHPADRTTRSGRRVRSPSRYDDYIALVAEEIDH
jgi:hypothetical protein